MEIQYVFLSTVFFYQKQKIRQKPENVQLQ